MNKKEAIEKIEKRKSTLNGWEELTRNHAFDEALDVVRKIDEPEKPVVPQFVADWIEWCKKNNVTLLGAMSPIDELDTAICDDKKVESLDAFKWATKNQETFAKAWLFCYEVEKEKLYTVEIPNPNSDDHLVLRKNINGKVCVNLLHSEYWRRNESTRLTKSEIRKDFDWAWKFAEEVEE